MDERLRTLERRAQTGDPEAEAALLRYRQQIRDLPRKRLRLAAYLGHPPAQLIYEEYLRSPNQRFDKWIRGILHYGGDAAGRRVALAAARTMVPVWGETFPEEEHVASYALGAAEEWIACPCPQHERAMRNSGIRLNQRAEHLTGGARMLADPRQRSLTQRAGRVARALCGVTFRPGRTSQMAAVEEAARIVGEERVRRAIQRELVPWALSPASGS